MDTLEQSEKDAALFEQIVKASPDYHESDGDMPDDVKAIAIQFAERIRADERAVIHAEYNNEGLIKELYDLREERAKAESQLVAYYDYDEEGGTFLIDRNDAIFHSKKYESHGWKLKPLFTSPPITRQHEQELREEIVAWQHRFPEYEYRKQDECVALKLRGE